MLLPSPEKEVVLDASSSLLPALTTQQPCAPCLLHRSPPWPGHWNSMQPMDWALPLVQHNHDSTRGENEASKMRLTVMPLQETLRWPPLAPRYLSIHEEGPRLFLTLAPLPYRFPLSLYSQCHIHSLTFSHMVFPSLLPSFLLFEQMHLSTPPSAWAGILPLLSLLLFTFQALNWALLWVAFPPPSPGLVRSLCCEHPLHSVPSSYVSVNCLSSSWSRNSIRAGSASFSHL